MNEFNETYQKQERDKKGKSLIDFPENYIVIDVETTGLYPSVDSLIEVAAIKIEKDMIIDEYSSLIKPNKNSKIQVTQFITELTGITNEMLNSSPLIDKIFPDFFNFIKDSLLIGHNVNFDINFLYDNSLRVLNKPIENDFIDTMRLSRRIIKDLKHYRLSDLSKYYNLNVDNAHRAMADCNTTYEVYQKLKKTAVETYGTLDQAITELNKKTYGNPGYQLKAKDIVPTETTFDIDHPLYGKYCVFTGTLEKMIRKDAMQHVVNLGGYNNDNVTERTNYLILGNNDYCKTLNGGKSSKHKKAESLKLKGNDIEIIPENVFYEMIEVI